MPIIPFTTIICLLFLLNIIDGTNITNNMYKQYTMDDPAIFTSINVSGTTTTNITTPNLTMSKASSISLTTTTTPTTLTSRHTSKSSRIQNRATTTSSASTSTSNLNHALTSRHTSKSSRIQNRATTTSSAPTSTTNSNHASKQIVLLTVATDTTTIRFKNWLNSAKHAGWNSNNIIVLGANETWGGWSWRSSVIAEYCASIDNRTIVVFSDSYDLLIFGSPNEFKSMLVQNDTNKCDIMFGIDHLCNQEYFKPFNIKPSCSGSIFSNRNVFINGGGIVGRAIYFQHAYQYISTHFEDDQIGWYHYIKQHHYLINTKLCYDEKNEMIFNFMYGNHKYREVKLLNMMMKFVEMCFNPWKTMNIIQDSQGRPRVLGSIPLMIHTPGIAVDQAARYNYIGVCFLPKFQQSGMTFVGITILSYVSVGAVVMSIIYMGEKYLRPVKKAQKKNS